MRGRSGSCLWYAWPDSTSVLGSLFWAFQVPTSWSVEGVHVDIDDFAHNRLATFVNFVPSRSLNRIVSQVSPNGLSDCGEERSFAEPSEEAEALQLVFHWIFHLSKI